MHNILVLIPLIMHKMVCMHFFYYLCTLISSVMNIDRKTGLVLEGGGMRGVFTSGVLDAFMKHDFGRCLQWNVVYKPPTAQGEAI